MANKQLHISSSSSSSSSRSRSPIILFSLAILTLYLLFYVFSSIQTQDSSPFPYSYPNPNSSLKPETSFVASLEHFLTKKAPPVRADTVRTVTEEDEATKRLDARMFTKESERFHGNPYYPLDFPIRVYVYEMPWKFTYELLWLFRNTYRDTDNLTSNGSPVHRLIEQVINVNYSILSRC